MKFYGIGVGPGDEKLLTIKAVETLKILDVLLIPETQKNKEGVAKKIANKYLKNDLEIIYIDFPMVEDEEVFVRAGKKAADIIEENVKNGKNVGFITLGDPSVYSTYGYIAKAVRGRVDMETIPGVTSFCAAAALANVPLVEKDEILSIVPMNADDDKIQEILSKGDSFAFMKVYHREKRVIKLLEENCLDKNALLALKCGFPEAAIKENAIEELAENKEYLSLVITRK